MTEPLDPTEAPQGTEVPQAEKKPPRKRAPRKKAAPSVAVVDDAVTSDAETDAAATQTAQTSEAGDVPAAKPTRAPRKRAPRKKAAVQAEQPDSEPAASILLDIDGEEIGQELLVFTSGEDVDTDGPRPALAAGSVLFVPPAVIAAQAEAQARAAADQPASASAPEDQLDDLDDEPDEAETREVASAEASGARRRRRRGRRGRGGRTVEDDSSNEASNDSSNEASNEASESDDPSDDSDAGDADEAPLSASARRRRRRRRSSDASDGDGNEDPPNTVTHVRGGRSERSERTERSDDDGVRGVKGSTRLEAKRQRRREGRDTGRRRPPILSEAEFLARRESVDRVMAVRELGDRTQIAVLEDNILVEHYVTRATATSYAGNVYLGRVQNVLPSMEAAFIDIGKARNGVLYAGEVNWDAAGIDGKARAIENALHSGDVIPVQVTKDPIGQKGARLTSQISLPGRFLVYVPNGAMTGISRKLPDTERTRLRSILKRIVPEEAGVIVRTAAEGASEEELTHDVERLKAQWEAIQAKAASPKSAPVLLHGEPDLAIRVVRDVFNEDFKKLIVQGERAWGEISQYIGDVAPDLVERASKHVGTRDLFTELRVDEQLTKALDRKVYLPSGGSLVIDRTEAMTVVDVNTGKFIGSGGNLEETVTRNNLEAAEEIVRQLRLRDVGGIVVIDFIDMVLESNRDLVLRRLTECLGRDRTKHQVAEVTSLGLVQMTRKRVGEGLLEAFSEPCEHCSGRGVMVHSEPVRVGAHSLEVVEENGGGGKKRSRRARGKAAAAEVETEAESPAMTEEQRRAAAHAMAAMAGQLHPDEGSDLESVEAEVVAHALDAAHATSTVDWVTDTTSAEPAELNGEAVGTVIAPVRRPRRRAASRPAGPPNASS